MLVPVTTDPAEQATLARMASIPHGTTIDAQGRSSTISGKPTIPAIDITPFTTGQPGNKIPFPSQTASDEKTARIPQNLAPFIAAGTITQAMLSDLATLLRNHIASQTITSTTVITISTAPASPLFGGGTGNIAFLLGNPAASAPNALRARPATAHHPGGSRRRGTARPRVPDQPAGPGQGTTHDQGRRHPDPVRTAGLPQLQRTDLATCVSRHARAG